MKKEDLKDVVVELLFFDLLRFSERILEDITKHEILNYTRVEMWIKKNIGNEEIDRITEDILKNDELMKRLDKEYRECMEYINASDLCKRYAVVSIVRKYFRKELYSKIMNWSK